VDVSKFKGKTLVNIREYYTDDIGDLKPGRKGISLSVDQWKVIVQNMERINDLILKNK